MDKFDTFMAIFNKEVSKTAKDLFSGYAKQAVKDASDFIANTKKDIKTWIDQLSKGEITLDDFEFFLKGQKDLAKMNALKQKRLGIVQINKFKSALIDIVRDAVSTVL